MEFNVPDMSCGHCAGVINKAVKALDPAAQVSVDLPARKVTIESSEDRQTVAEALAEAGYPAE
ncbi:MAG: heavy-metal-associated domain-containing protein [Polaromonas sp.]|uniref:heavy-metal-associated domain-containing protein n=1 Tax=Polaromonas sp. TaxID=1869339 RepID=UPI0032646389